MSTVKDIIDYVDLLKPNAYTDAQKLVWFNRLEQDVKRTVMKNFIKSDIARVKDTAIYDLPAGVVFEDIDTVFFDKIPVEKLDQRSYIDTVSNVRGYYKTTAGKLGIQPSPNVSDDSGTYGIRLVYLENLTPFTATSGTLLIPDQFKDVYEFYLISKIEFFNKEYEAYTNTSSMFNAAWNDFANWYKGKQPVNVNLKVINLI